ncbi:MAG: hypothetical protein QXR73_00550 [Candidatus Micrarchaeaceae archaeon]
MQKILSSMNEFRSSLKRIVLDPKHDCGEMVAECIMELKEYAHGDVNAFHRAINSSMEELVISASSMKANSEKEYNMLVHNVLSAVGLLFDVSLKDEKVSEAITEGLRMWQTRQIEQSLRDYRNKTKLRR